MMTIINKDMKGDITLRLLEAIGVGVSNASDLFATILDSGYGASIGKLEYAFSKRQRARSRRTLRREEEERLRRRYYYMLFHLREQGLVAATARGRGLSLTRKGRQKLAELKKRLGFALPTPHYQRTTGVSVVIVTFDIPESERRKRAWLRTALKHLGLKMIQKSVWVGRVTLHKQFLDDLLKMQLVEFVEIFEVTRSGSLANVL